MNEKSPWIKPIDRLPSEKEGRYVFTLHKQGFYNATSVKTVAKYPDRYEYWMPIPGLPNG